MRVRGPRPRRRVRTVAPAFRQVPETRWSAHRPRVRGVPPPRRGVDDVVRVTFDNELGHVPVGAATPGERVLQSVRLELPGSTGYLPASAETVRIDARGAFFVSIRGTLVDGHPVLYRGRVEVRPGPGKHRDAIVVAVRSAVRAAGDGSAFVAAGRLLVDGGLL